MLSPEVYLPKTDFERQQHRRGKDEGKAEGKAESVLLVLAARQISVNAEEKARILQERDLATLDRWIHRATTVRAAADLF